MRIIYIHIYINVYIHTTFWFQLVLLIYTCLSMTTWDWITYQGACCWRRLILSRQPLIACSSFRVGALWDFSLFTLACQLVLSLWRSIFGGILLRFHECSFPGVARRNFLTADVNSMFIRKFWPCQQIFLSEYSRNGILAFSTYMCKGSQSLHTIQFNRQIYLLGYFFQLCPNSLYKVHILKGLTAAAALEKRAWGI